MDHCDSQPQFKNVNREDDHDGQWSPCVGVPALLMMMMMIIVMAYRHIPTMTGSHHGGFLSVMIMVGICQVTKSHHK